MSSTATVFAVALVSFLLSQVTRRLFMDFKPLRFALLNNVVTLFATTSDMSAERFLGHLPEPRIYSR
jgi:hypothetical protein